MMEEEKAEYSRIESIMTDLMYLLRVPYDQGKFNDEIRKKFCRGTAAFLQLMYFLQVRVLCPFIMNLDSHVMFGIAAVRRPAEASDGSSR